MSNKDKFWETYREQLKIAVETTPDDYPPGVSAANYAAEIATKFAAQPFSHISHEGRGFRLTCKKLGIKQTRKAIQAYLES